MWKAIKMKDRVRAGRASKRMNEIVGKNFGLIVEAEGERTRQRIKHGRGPRLMKTKRARRTREMTHEEAQERCERTEMYNAQMTSEGIKSLTSIKFDYNALIKVEEGEIERESDEEQEQLTTETTEESKRNDHKQGEAVSNEAEQK